jgi:DNA-binding MarR family transcriptional regulator
MLSKRVKPRARADDDLAPEELADRLHSAAIHLLRRLRRADSAMGLSAPKASALSVLVFGGPQTLNSLAQAEQVRAPTMSRLIAELERDGLVSKTADRTDRRVVRIAATATGRALLEEGRTRRLSQLTAALADLTSDERANLSAALAILERLARSSVSGPRTNFPAV